MKNALFLCCFLFSGFLAKSQVGCPDPQATNYSASATQNDGSCLYAPTSYTLPVRDTLDKLVEEVSGIIYRNGKLYVHNDSGNPNRIYELDTATGAITKTIILGTKANVDWEDITQSDTHVFIGDFGNNVGTRQNLVIYKFPASLLNQPGTSITIPDAQIEAINYSYPNQTSFVSNNATPFDCEAMAWRNNHLHLFSKNQGGGVSYHYRLPDTAGTYVATLLDSLDTQQIRITGADFAQNGQLMLIGYQTTGLANCALWYVYDFTDENTCLQLGNKRKLDIGIAATVGQVEGICFSDTSGGFAANERFVYPQLQVDVPNKLYRFTTTAWYPYVLPNAVSEWANAVSPYHWHGQALELDVAGNVHAYSINGQLLKQVHAGKPGTRMELSPGTYIIRFQAPGKRPLSEQKIIR